MTVEMAALTDTGTERPHNEDTVHTEKLKDGALLAVADGMGGHSAGDVASQEAMDVFSETVRSAETEDREQRLVEGVERANEHLQEMVANDPELQGMGTTLVAALVTDGTATIVNVGDSRAYHATDERIEQVTTDQSLVQQLVEEGTIDSEEAEDHPQRNVLAQALGTDETIDPDLYSRTVEGVVVLCSDGVSDELADTEIQEIVTADSSLESCAGVLVDRANEVDGSDNISVVLAQTRAKGEENDSDGLDRIVEKVTDVVK